MYRHILITSLASLFLILIPHAEAQDAMESGSDSLFSADAEAGVTSSSGASVDEAETQPAAGNDSSVDANGNMTIKANGDYSSPIDLSRGNLIVSAGASVTKSVRVRNGNILLGDNSEILGNVTVDTGNLTVGENGDIQGSVSVGGSLIVKANANISGPVSVRSSGVIIVGDNVDMEGTLTSAGGLKIGANADVKLFLSGQSVEIDGKVYKLGGKILASGSNTSVGLPFVPKLKDGQVMTATTTAPLEAQQGEQTASSEPEQSSDTDDDWTLGASNFFLPDIADIQDEEDIAEYVSDVISANTDVRAMKLTAEAIDLDYKAPVALFGFIPMNVQARISVSKDKTVDVSYPWYSFLMSTDEEELKEAVSKTVEDSLSASAGGMQNGFSAKIQATIANGILSAFKDLF